MRQASKSGKDDEKKWVYFVSSHYLGVFIVDQNSVIQVLHRCTADVLLLKQSFFLGTNCQS